MYSPYQNYPPTYYYTPASQLPTPATGQSVAPTPAQPKERHVKAHFVAYKANNRTKKNEQIRRFRIVESLSYHDFEQLVREKFGSTIQANLPLTMKYQDDEKDLVCFSSETEWRDAFTYAQEDQVLRVYLSQTAAKESSPSSPSVLPGVPKANEIIHSSVTCDGCNQYPLRGTRYKCKNCHNFDFCQKCYEARNDMGHPPSHTFVAHALPALWNAKLRNSAGAKRHAQCNTNTRAATDTTELTLDVDLNSGSAQLFAGAPPDLSTSDDTATPQAPETPQAEQEQADGGFPYCECLGYLQDMGLVFKPERAKQLLIQYNGDIARTIDALTAEYNHDYGL